MVPVLSSPLATGPIEEVDFGAQHLWLSGWLVSCAFGLVKYGEVFLELRGIRGVQSEQYAHRKEADGGSHDADQKRTDEAQHHGEVAFTTANLKPPEIKPILGVTDSGLEDLVGCA